jgi:hypothetical protein
MSAGHERCAKGWLVKKTRKIPAAFASEAEERAYWKRKDSTADLDWRQAQGIRLPNLSRARPRSRSGFR